ncbi:transporter substrate-binding domain-containing protein [Paraburkholderia sediminicola]|uniref:Transporter substrate-binding domain-containing protein n=1 Tax=Paraburkholderia rhynchosiae TaxID=487049 RepID=A0ACC7NKR5_9BURK
MSFLLSACFVASTAHAEELTGTLKKIKDSGVMTLGARESTAPFSYRVQGTEFAGYSYDIMMKVVDRIKTELKAPNLQVKVIPFTAQNRIPLIQNGTLDLECSTTTNTPERQKQVAFSDSIFVIGERLITAKTSGIHDFADLRGKNVATTAGTTTERTLNKLNDEKKLGMNIMAVQENSQAFLAVESGRAVAFAMDDAILYGERAKSKDPSNWVVVGTPQTREAYGCIMSKDDAPFKKLVDTTVAGLMKSGEIMPIYKKWFEQPIPPRGNALQFAISDDVKRLYANPNDTALQ